MNEAKRSELSGAPGSAWSRDRVALANADYEQRRRRDPSYDWSIRTIEREWKLKAGQLTNYRSNRRHRKDSGVSLLFPKSKWPTIFAATITGSNERTGSEMPAEGNRDGSVWSSGHPRESLSAPQPPSAIDHAAAKKRPCRTCVHYKAKWCESIEEYVEPWWNGCVRHSPNTKPSGAPSASAPGSA